MHEVIVQERGCCAWCGCTCLGLLCMGLLYRKQGCCEWGCVQDMDCCVWGYCIGNRAAVLGLHFTY